MHTCIKAVFRLFVWVTWACILNCDTYLYLFCFLNVLIQITFCVLYVFCFVFVLLLFCLFVVFCLLVYVFCFVFVLLLFCLFVVFCLLVSCFFFSSFFWGWGWGWAEVAVDKHSWYVLVSGNSFCFCEVAAKFNQLGIRNSNILTSCKKGRGEKLMLWSGYHVVITMNES